MSDYFITGQSAIETSLNVRKREIDRYRHHPLSSYLLEHLDRLGGVFRIERSFKFTRKRLLCGRFIVTVPLLHDSSDSIKAVLNIFKGIKLPTEVFNVFEVEIKRANKVHFGFEGDGDGGLLKVYLEFPYIHKEGNIESWEMLLSCKWDPFSGPNFVMTSYKGLPVYSPKEVYEKTIDFFKDENVISLRGFIAEILMLCDRQSQDLRMWLLNVTENGNPRNSFDFKTYSAKLSIGQITSYLPDLCRFYEIPISSCEPYFASISNHKFGHVSCGTGRDGNFFIAIYHEAPGQ